MRAASNSIRVRLIAISAGAALLATGSVSLAQQALGNGRMLDRNPRVGSGGRNERARDITYNAKYNNAIITGNAGYGKSFQGYVGYLAPDDFRASLGSNDLYRYRRDSSSGSTAAQGIRGTDALRYQFSLTTGQNAPSMLGGVAPAASGASPIASRSGSSGQSYSSSPGGAALRSTSDFLGQRSLRPTVVGYRTDPDGKNYAVTASPLLGITQVPLTNPTAPMIPAPPQLVPQPPAPNSVLPTPGTLQTKPELVDTGKEAVKSTKQQPGNQLSGVESSRAGVPNPFAAQQIIDNTASASRLNTRVEAPLIVVDQFKRELPPERSRKATTTEPPAKEDAPVKAYWEIELDRLRERLKKGEEASREGSNTKSTKPDRNSPSGTPDKDPKGEDGEEKDDEKDKPSTGPMSMEEIRAIVQPDLEKIDKDVRRAIAGARPLIDRLSTPKTNDSAAYTSHMTAGEAFLSEGRFFDAEDRFLRAIAASPGDPLASVGRAHAQIGAGLYLSAGMNLHSLFQEHPEMLGTRYNRALLPSAQRTATIAAQMRQNLGTARTLLGRDAALLLAYLGYQTDDRAMLEEGVKAFAERTETYDKPERTFLALMQHVWVDGPDAKLPAPPTPAPDTNK